MRISDWSSDVCSSDLGRGEQRRHRLTIARPTAACRATRSMLRPLALRQARARLIFANHGGHDRMAFYELRQYHIRRGKMADWLKLMEEEIIPFQVSRGMVICGSFRGESDESVYVWLR